MSKTKKKRMSRSLITAVAVISFLLSMSGVSPAVGTDEPKIDNMTISIMPDYDDPRVLVVLEPILSGDTNLPSTVKFPISAKEENLEIGMACEVVDGNHSCKSYTTEKSSDFNELSFTVNSSRDVFLEYYWDAFQEAKDKNRTFIYDYKAPYSIKQLTIAIQEPKQSTGFKVEPASSDVQKDQEGLKEHIY